MAIPTTSAKNTKAMSLVSFKIVRKRIREKAPSSAKAPIRLFRTIIIITVPKTPTITVVDIKDDEYERPFWVFLYTAAIAICNKKEKIMFSAITAGLISTEAMPNKLFINYLIRGLRLLSASTDFVYLENGSRERLNL